MTAKKLNIEHLSKESFVNIMEHIIYDIRINKVFISEKKTY